MLNCVLHAEKGSLGLQRECCLVFILKAYFTSEGGVITAIAHLISLHMPQDGYAVGQQIKPSTEGCRTLTCKVPELG